MWWLRVNPSKSQNSATRVKDEVWGRYEGHWAGKQHILLRKVWSFTLRQLSSDMCVKIPTRHC